MEEVTPQHIQQLRQEFASRVNEKNPDFCPQDMERVKTDNLWLTRFVAHAENDMKIALDLLYDCCLWRKEFGTNDLDHTKLPAQIFEKGVLFIRGEDKWGKKLLIFKAKFHTKGSEPIENLQKFIVYFFERIERETKSDQISIIFDMKDTGWNNMDMDFVRYLITLLKTYYPFFVNYLVIFEMPWLLNAAWKIIKGWLPPKFVDRVKFLDKKTLKDYINEEHQLVDWGGKDTYQYEFKPEPRQKRSGQSKGGPEAKARKHNSKVKFSGNDQESPASPSRSHGSQEELSPPQSPGASIPSPAYPTSDTHTLVEVDSSVSFHSNEDEDYVAQLRIRNIDPNGSKVIFKIKTTSPDKYRVKPTIGVADRNGIMEIVITTHPGVTSGSMLRDRFQLQVARVPTDVQLSNIDSSEAHTSTHGNFQQLNTFFKRIVNAQGAFVETYRVGLKVERRSGDNGTSSGGNMVAMSEERMKKGLDDLERKISESVTKKVEPKLAKLEKMNKILIIIVIAMFLVFGFIMWFRTSSNACCSVAGSCPGTVDDVSWTRTVSGSGDAADALKKSEM